MALLTTSTGALSVEMKTYFNKVLLVNARPNLVYQQFGKKFMLPRGAGKIAEWRQANVFTAATTPLTEGVPPTENTFGYTSINVTIAQYGDYVKGSDLLVATTIDPILDDLATEQGAQIGLTLDTLVRDAVVAGTVVRYASTATSRVTVAAGMTPTFNDLVKCRRDLLINLARPFNQGMAFGMVIHPMIEAAMYMDASFQALFNAGSTQNNPVWNAEFNKVLNIRFTVSTNGKVFTGAGAAGIDVYASMIFGSNAFTVVQLTGETLEHLYKPKDSDDKADPLNQYWTAGWKVSFAVKILKDANMLRYESAGA